MTTILFLNCPISIANENTNSPHNKNILNSKACHQVSDEQWSVHVEKSEKLMWVEHEISRKYIDIVIYREIQQWNNKYVTNYD